MNILKQKRGFAITEVLLAIAVIVIVGISSYALYINSKDKADMDVIKNNVAMLQSVLTKFNMNTLRSSDMTIDKLNDMGLVPDSIQKDSSGTWSDTIGTSYQVHTLGIGVTNKYLIRMTNIKRSECFGLASRLSQLGDSIWIVYGGQSQGAMRRSDPNFTKNVSDQCNSNVPTMVFQGMDFYDVQ